jgi:hypothetical protein
LLRRSSPTGRSRQTRVLSGSYETEADMDQFVRSQNVARYRRLLERGDRRIRPTTDNRSACRRAPEAKRRWRSVLIALDGGELRPILIIDLAKISAFPICLLSAAAGPTIPHTALSPEDQCSEPVASNNGRPRFRSGSLFCGSGPFPSRWPLLNFGVTLEIDPNQSIL